MTCLDIRQRAVPQDTRLLPSPYGELQSTAGVITIPFLREHGVFVPARIIPRLITLSGISPSPCNPVYRDRKE
jgi:hypothetical protein